MVVSDYMTSNVSTLTDDARLLDAALLIREDRQTKNPITISPGAPISEAVQILYSKKVGGLIVVEGEELKGILTVSDMLELLNELLARGDDKFHNVSMGV